MQKETIERLAKAWLAETSRLQSLRLCYCGCRQIVSGRMKRFRQGHDAKLLSEYRKKITAILAGQSN